MTTECAQLRAAITALADKWKQIADRTESAPGLQDASCLPLYVATVRYLTGDLRALTQVGAADTQPEGACPACGRTDGNHVVERHRTPTADGKVGGSGGVFRPSSVDYSALTFPGTPDRELVTPPTASSKVDTAPESGEGR